MLINRRDLVAQAGTLGLSTPLFTSAAKAAPHGSGRSDHLTVPDAIAARAADGAMTAMTRQGSTWSTTGLKISLEPEQQANGSGLNVALESARNDIAFLRLRWRRRIKPDARVLADTWERAYGELGWRGLSPERVLPWYFTLAQGNDVASFGVETQPNAFCFWQCDPDGISLWIDLRNGGEPAHLSGRRLALCRVLSAQWSGRGDLYSNLRAFCARMCQRPLLPAGPIVGSNDWNYAYGRNTAGGILRDAKLMVELSPPGHRPFVVIDDGWQDKKRFPDLADLAAQMRSSGARPGIWIRPLRAEERVRATRLRSKRFGDAAAEEISAYDPSVPDGMNATLRSVLDARAQGFEFIKHDFTTFELFGQWGRDMGAQPGRRGWQFADATRTTAEIVLDLYRSIRSAAGSGCTILGCNTFGHLAAGIFETQRISDDTSGREWERTRRFGVNALAYRIPQHRTFFHADPDIVAVTRIIPWRLTAQWLDVVARSGTALFVAPAPDAMSDEARAAVRAAFVIAVGNPAGHPVPDATSQTPETWRFTSPSITRLYDWDLPDGADPFA
jgi:alpha-galactosidase